VLRKPAAHYAVALTVSSGAGLALELAQIVAPGDPSIKDLIRDIVGAFAGLAIAATLDPAFPRLRRPLARWGLRLVAVALLGRVVYPVVRIAWLLDERKAAFPMLADFESTEEEPFVQPGFGAKLARVPPPKAFSHATAVGR
jgi:hypothetical protein